MANNAVTILPPTHFYGDAAVDTLTPTTFYREILARMRKDQTIVTDARKIAFVVEHLRGDAYDWYENITRTVSGNPLNVFADFQKGFCTRFDVESLSVEHGFDTSDINKMRTTEPLDGYYDRIACYFNNRLPIQKHIKGTNIEKAVTTLRETHPECTGVQRTAWREQLTKVAEESIVGYTDQLIRHIWIRGMHPQFRSVAMTMDDPEKETRVILAAMKRRFPNSRLSNAKNVPAGTPKQRVAEVAEENAEEDQQSEEVAALTKTGAKKKQGRAKTIAADKKKIGKCNHCGIWGHKAENCRKKAGGIPPAAKIFATNTSTGAQAPQIDSEMINQLALAVGKVLVGQPGAASAVGTGQRQNF